MRAHLYHIVVMCMLIATRDTCEPHVNLDSFNILLQYTQTAVR